MPTCRKRKQTPKLSLLLRAMTKAMEKLNAEFVGSFPEIRKCPKGDFPEYAFIGRSNVGKSSLINMLCEEKKMAHTSNKPGKTQLMNYYLINRSWHMVDLPGYGYAKISKKKRLEWERMTATYMQKRENLFCAFVLIDSNIPPQQVDIDFLNKLGHWRCPFVIVYTKTDRVKPHKLEENLTAIRTEILKYWNELPQEFITSANSGLGRNEIIEFINSVNEQAT